MRFKVFAKKALCALSALLLLCAMTSCERITPLDINADVEPVQTEPPPISEITEPEPDSVPDELVDDGATVTISIGGDTCLDGYYGGFADTLSWAGLEYPFEAIKHIFDDSDITIVNLETSVSDRGESEKREGFGFRTPPELLQAYSNAGVDIVCLANNHIRDFGYDALLDAFDHLESYGIDYVGAGRDLNHARECKIYEINGITVGFLAYNTIIPTGEWYADEGKAGVAGWSDSREEMYLADVQKYSEECDVLLVSMHWGNEETYELTELQKTLARKLVDAGADVVIGHHPHVLQGIEMYNGAPIFYSVGNLLFYKIEDDLDGLTAVFQLEMSRNGVVSLKLHPVFISNYRTNLLDPTSERYLRTLSTLGVNSVPFGTGIALDGSVLFNYDGELPIIPPMPEEEDSSEAQQ